MTTGQPVRPEQPLRVGMVGAGTISAQYLATLERLDDLALTAVADLDAERAQQVAESAGATAMSVTDLLNHDQVDVVLNLTIPGAHAEVSLAALAGGKHVYVEKPFTATVEEGEQVLVAARQAGLVVGSAPDTVLGTGIQTAREALARGAIGTPISAMATMVTPGHERWHSNPDFYYQAGGGPLLDMGPYYVTSLITLLGPVRQVIGASSALRAERVIGSGPRAGDRIPVHTDTHVAGILVHTNGAISSLVMSFDATATRAAPIELHGTAGSMAVPDPNRFDGTVSIHTNDHGWADIPVTAGYQQAGRGYGLADLYWSGAFSGDPAAGRARGDLGLHVLEVMQGVLTAAQTGQAVTVTSQPQLPPPVPLDSR